MGDCFGGKKPVTPGVVVPKKEDTVKILLLGSGESGKSTFFKQVRILYVNGYTKDELFGIRDTIRENIVRNLKLLVKGAREKNFKVSEGNQQAAQFLDDFQIDDSLEQKYTTQLIQYIQSLWKDDAIQKAFEFKSEFQVFDSAEYFFKDLERVTSLDYSPTLNDMIRCRTKTTGIVNVEFTLDQRKFKLTDVGGQRSERKKWIHCFDDANAILFVVAMSEYDLKCYEDDITPRMNESLQLFEEICNNKYFTNTPIVLLLNKDDVFRDKIKKTSLKVWDNEYTGESGDYQAGVDFIKQKFLSKNHISERHIDVFVCTTTETDVVKKAFEEVKGAILKNKNSKK